MPRMSAASDKILHRGAGPGVGFPPGAGERKALFRSVVVVLSAGFRQTKDDPVDDRRDKRVGRGLGQGELYLRAIKAVGAAFATLSASSQWRVVARKARREACTRNEL